MSRYLLADTDEFDSTDVEDTTGVQLYSPSSALTASLIGTLAPLPTLVLTFPGLMFGPSLGYFYGGMPGRAWTGIGIRTAGVGGMVLTFAICGWDCGPGQQGYTTAWVVFIAGGAITVGSAIYDLATVKESVRKRNEEIKSGARFSIGIRYYADVRTPGIGITFSF